MKDESEIREQYEDRLRHYRETDMGNKDFQHGYVFALQWVLEDEDDKE